MKINVLGVGFDNVTLGEAVELGAQLMEQPGFHYVVTPNPEFILAAEKDPEFQTVLNGADLVGELEARLDSVHITVNKNKIPGDPRSANETSGIRVGTPAVTARGFKEAEAVEVGALLALAANDFEAKKDEIVERVDALCKRFPLYE